MKTKENGVTLVALVTMIVLLLILTSIGYTVGNSTIESVKFTQFKSELKLMQSKVNELNQEGKNDIGEELTDNQKSILNKQEISDIIYNGRTDEEKTKIQNGFRYVSQNYINTELNLNSVKRDYLINVEYSYVIFPDGFNYKGTTYYMIDQIDGEIYNVHYNDKNEKSGSFEVTVTEENNKCKIEISNIQYNGYVDKWQVKYKLEGNSYWKTSDDLNFYLEEDGTYEIKVVHGNEIDLGTKSVEILYYGLITNKIQNDIVKIGDYVQYIPDTASTTDILSELSKYSGNTDTTQNTTDTLTQENLNWRVLDIEDGKVRLISEVPTTSTVALEGSKGYNNSVYLLDKTCSTLYNNSTYAEKVQSLKIEDVEKYLTYDYTQYENSEVDTGKYGGTKTFTDASYRYYPNLFAKEKTGCVDGIQGTELNLSEQTTPIDEGATQAGKSIKVTQTYWYKLMKKDDFTDSIYYNLYINNGSNYHKYWMSSRCTNVYYYTGDFYAFRIGNGYVDAGYFNNSTNGNPDGHAYFLRPVITLNANVQIDTTDETKNGLTAENAWILKIE